MGRTTRIGDALSQYLKDSGLGVLLKHQNIYRAWARVVGPGIAPQTRIVAFRRGALIVEVASSSLYAELKTFYLPSLVASVQQQMGSKRVRAIKLRLGEFVGDLKNGRKSRQGQDQEQE